ncbi:MAG: type I methionyl aminopeptidase, partial [Chromatiales bacterium]
TGLELREGLTFTIEPMVNVGKRHVRLLPDGWTVVTRDHSLSAQWEHTVLITRDGCEVLTLGADEKR